MPTTAPSPLDALRHHSRAVVLTAEGRRLSDRLGETLRRSGLAFEVADHPLLAMAILTGMERDASAQDRPCLVIAERHLDDLDGLFAAIRARLSRVAIWVFEADIAIEVRRGQPAEAPRAAPREPLRIVEPRRGGRAGGDSTATRERDSAAHARDHSFAASLEDPDLEGSRQDPLEPSGQAVTPAELEMLLDPLEGDQQPPPGDGGRR